MYIDETKVWGLIDDKTVRYSTTSTNTDIMTELAKILDVTKAHLEASSVEKTARWSLHKNRWLQNENGCISSSVRNYARGDVIFSLDLGTSNIGTEIRYPHPCVVIYDQDEDWVVVAPITAAPLDPITRRPITHPPFDVLAMAQKRKPKDPREYFFTKHSVIQVDQIRRVSKYRALNKDSKKIRLELLNQIDNIILNNFVPLKAKLIKKLETELKSSKDTIQALEQKNAELKEKAKMLEDEIIDLKAALKLHEQKQKIEVKITG